jgi:hypothetical protein
MLFFILGLFKPTPKIPKDYMRMVRTEYRSVPEDYIEFFMQKNNRLPTMQELKDVI